MARYWPAGAALGAGAVATLWTAQIAWPSIGIVVCGFAATAILVTSLAKVAPPSSVLAAVSPPATGEAPTRERDLEFADTLSRTMLEASPLGIMVVDASDRVITYNRRFIELSMVPAGMLAAGAHKPILDAFADHVKDTEAFRARVRYLYAHMSEPAIDEIVMKDGRVLERHSVELRSPAGQSFGRIWSFDDITAIKTAERVLREERDFVDVLLDSLPGYFVLIDAAGRLVRWNETLRTLNGLTNEQITGANPFANVLDGDRQKINDKIRETLTTGSSTMEFRIQSRRGVLDLRWQARRLMVDGKPHVLAIGLDVTALHESEALLRAGERRFRDIFESATEGIMIQDASTGAFIDANPRMLDLLGYTHDELIGLDPLSISVAAPADVRARRALVITDNSRRAEAFEWQFRTKSGGDVWCGVSSRYIANFDGRGVILAMVRDISEHRQTTEAIAYRDRILHAVTLSTAELVKALSLDDSMTSLLQAVGEELGVDRLMVIQRAGLESTPVGAAMAFGWQRPGVVHIDLAELGLSSAEAKTHAELAAWFAPLATGIPVMTYAATATGVVREILQKGNTISNLLQPITINGAYWGHFGVEDTHSFRTWNAIELDALHTLADVVGSLIEREQIASARDRADAIIARMATHDVLTDLPNRRFFIDALNVAIARSKRSGQSFAVLYLDLDHFKDINDTLGHPVGDQLLQAVATRLRSGVREIDTVARFGGDEFAAIQIDIREAADAAVLADKLVQALALPFAIEGNEIRSGASLGIAVYGEDSPDAESLLAHADIALYRAKADGRGTYRFFTDSMDVAVRERVSMESELRDALALGEFFLLYQPQIDAIANRIVGVEALVRWQHPKRGIVLPERFVPMAESCGLMFPLGAWVFGEACRQMKHWIDAGCSPATIGINVSALQFKAPHVLEELISSMLAASGVAAPRIELELTESTLMDVSRNHNETLVRLRTLGFRFAIDDFGNGYSSLEYLRRFRVDRIKIAQNFVDQLGRDAESGPIVRATIGLAHELGITVVAEGVETAEQVALLTRWGCREVQGNYFATPLSATEMGAFLEKGSA